MDDRSNVLLRAAAPSPRQRNAAAIASFTLAAASLAGLVLGPWLPAASYGFLLHLPAIFAGHLARRQFVKRPGAYANEGMATFGLAIGYFGLFITVVIVVSMAFGMITFRPAK